MVDVVSQSPLETIDLGRRLAPHLHPGDLILLLGEFGVGKTHFVKGIAEGFGSPDLVTSPSFVLINEYHTGPSHRGLRIYHVDLYRLEDPAELAGIGLEEILDTQDICIIEWAERAQGWLPHAHLSIHIQAPSESERRFQFVPQGSRYHDLVTAFKHTMAE